MSKLSPELEEELNSAIANHRLEAVASQIKSNASECWALVASQRDDYSLVGNTRFGGEPDLPVGVEWPTHLFNTRYCNERKNSNFIAQINFSEMPQLPNEDILPTSGLLYIFINYMEAASDPVLLHGIYFDGDFSTLKRHQTPPLESLCNDHLGALVPQSITTVPSVSVATHHESFLQQVDDNTDTYDYADGDMRLIELGYDLDRNQNGQIGQLLGFANSGDYQDKLYRNVVLEQLGKRNIMYWDSIDKYDAFVEKFKPGELSTDSVQRNREDIEWLMSNRELFSSHIDQWRLLFRIDSNSAMNLSINDSDPLYVFIRNEDLANKNFSNLAGEVTQG